MSGFLALLASLVEFVVKLIFSRSDAKKLEDERVLKLEEAAAKERAERLARIDAKATTATDRTAADELLTHVTGPDDPDTN